MNHLRRLDIQTKIILVLVAVIVPTFLVTTILQNKLALPILEGEMRALGLSTGESVAAKILASRWHLRADGARLIENELQEQLFLQPTVIRCDVFLKDATTGALKFAASNILEEGVTPMVPLVDKPTAEYRKEEGIGIWDILVPIKQPVTKGRTNPPKVHGVVHVQVSTKTITGILDTFWRITVVAALASVVVLMLFLTYFLRKAVANERLLRLAENQNLQLSEQLHEAQRELMNVEKFAVMGQLTANFAHEIGTPLNAIGGHLQLLKTDTSSDKGTQRMEIIDSQLKRIAEIVKGFLQTTAKPVSQRQLVDLNALVDKTLGIVRPRLDAMGLDVKLRLDRGMGPLRAVPLDLEQILLNLVSNALDSLATKNKRSDQRTLKLEIETRTQRIEGNEWAEVSVYDTGLGIKKEDLINVTKPFFTTKRPGEGTGLGLTICQQLASKYGGVLNIDSKEGAWAQVKLQLPYQTGLDA